MTTTEVNGVHEADAAAATALPLSGGVPPSVFAKERASAYNYYRVALAFRDKLIGGIPKSPKVIEAWLRTKAMITDEEELHAVARRTLIELGLDGDTYEDLVAAADAVADERHTNGFKRDERGLFIESRIVKSMIKECVNIRFPGVRKGPTRKGMKNYAAERVFILEDRIYLGRDEPDGAELQIAHVSGPQGPRSSLTNVEYAERAVITFTIKELTTASASSDPSLTPEEWAQVWVVAEENGLGSSRSQSHGRFNVIAWEQIAAPLDAV